MLSAASFAVPFGIINTHGSLFSWHVAVVGLGVALLSSIVPYLLEMRAFRMLKPGVAALLLSAAPAISAVVGTIFLGEQLSIQGWGAVVLIVVSSAGCALTSRSNSGDDVR